MAWRPVVRIIERLIRKRILIVEDTLDIADALRELMEMRGYEAIVAISGMEGVELAKQERPDLILMDVAMPDLDGIPATRMILEDNPSVPIVAVTSYAEGHEKELLAAGYVEVFNKSAFILSYTRTLRRYLGE